MGDVELASRGTVVSNGGKDFGINAKLGSNPAVLQEMDNDDGLSVASEELAIDVNYELEGGCTSMSLEQGLAYWYAIAPCAVKDIVGDLGGNESMLLSIDGLILSFSVTAHHSCSSNESLQFLQLASRIESFLENIRACSGAAIHIVGFNCFKCIYCRKAPALWGFRQALVSFFRNKNISIALFDDWYSADYQLFLESTQPFVVLAEDGSNFLNEESILSSALNMNTYGRENAADVECVYEAGEHGHAVLYGFILDSLRRGYSVALYYNMEFSGARITTTVYTTEAYSHKTFDACCRTVEVEKALALSLDKLIDPSIDSEWDVSPKEQIILSTCVEIMRDVNDEDRLYYNFFIKSLFLQMILTTCLSIEDRKCIVPDMGVEYDNMINLMGLLLSHYTEKVLTSEGMESHDGHAEVLDLIDEACIRRSMMFFGCSEKPVESVDFVSHVSDKLNSLWSCLTTFRLKETGLNLDESFFPVIVPDDVKSIAKMHMMAMSSMVPGDLPLVGRIEPSFLIQSVMMDKGGIISDAMRVFESSKCEDLMKGSQNTKYGISGMGASMSVPAYDRSYSLINHNKIKGNSDSVPRWIEKLPADRQARAIHSWKLRNLQDKKLFARNVNKYMGGLDSLHRPIVMLGDHCSSDHPWAARIEPLEESEAKISKKLGKVKKEKKEKIVKTSTKAAAIIEKNNEVKEQKTKKRDEGTYNTILSSIKFSFKKRSDSPAALHAALMEILIGAKNALDTTVLQDFSELRRQLSSQEVIICVVEQILIAINQLFTVSWTRRKFGNGAHDAEILKMVGFTFRIVVVAALNYMSFISPKQIVVFQQTLLLLGLFRSSDILFKNWSETQYAMSCTVADEQDSGSHVAKKSQKKSTSQVPDSKEVAKLEHKKEKFFKQIEEYRVTKLPTDMKFEFAIAPGYEAVFQLKLLGNDMTRSLGSTTDSRVGFTPDFWQVQLLNAVDARRSCMVVAPTSSGKTFACYYAMDQVLRYDNESCVVFVSPTRALALQVEAEVVARFSGKSYPSGCKTVLYGRLYEDRNENWDKCQILITVPVALECVLSSRDAACRRWVKKLKYAIIDEIHCIGDSHKGLETQHLLQLLPCPFMALSATISNESDFTEWLNKAQSMHKASEIDLIVHKERYADLQTMYFNGEKRQLMNLNPIVCVSYSNAKNGILSDDMYLTPKDCLALYEAFVELDIIKSSSDDYVKFFTENWHPEEYFCGSADITKYQYRHYVNSLLASLEFFIQTGIIREPDYEQFIRRIGSGVSVTEVKPFRWYDPATPTPNEEEVCVRDIIENNPRKSETLLDSLTFLHLVRTLEQQVLLPALMFNFNRTQASRIFYRVLNYLLETHNKKFHGTPELSASTKAINKEREDAYKSEIAKIEMAEKWKTLSKQQREEQGIDETMLSELLNSAPAPPTKLEDEFDAETYLCDKRMFIGCDKEFNEIIAFCRLDYFIKVGRVPPILLQGLRRGIGLYHDALHREYRRAVELLFRARYLRIVVSDVALSLGVNMPCRTTIFAGSMATLTPLLYRQTAGRAGRRGFDNVGNIVFWDFTPQKLTHVLCCKLSGLYGDTPVTHGNITERLKTFQLVCNEAALKYESDEAKFSRFAKHHGKNLTKLFTNTLNNLANGIGSDSREEMYKVSFRMLLDLMNQCGIVDSRGEFTYVSAIIEAIKDRDNNGLFFVYCLLNGYFNDIGNGMDRTRFELHSRIIAVVEHCVGIRHLHFNVVRRFELAHISQNVSKRLFAYAPSGEDNMWSPITPPMEDELLDLAIQFDNLVIDSFRDSMRCLGHVLRYKQSSGPTLAFTKTGFKKETEDIGAKIGEFISKTKIPQNLTLLQSDFETGKCDSDYHTIPSIRIAAPCYVPHDIQVPQLALGQTVEVTHYNSGKKAMVSLRNGYIRDIYSYPSFSKLILNNGIAGNDVWFVCSDSFYSIASLADALKSITIDSTEPATMNNLVEQFNGFTERCKEISSML